MQRSGRATQIISENSNGPRHGYRGPLFFTVFLLLFASQIITSSCWAISWSNDLLAALERAKTDGKPVMADFYTYLCGWCKRLDKDTFEDAKVGRIADGFICVKVNCEADKAAPSKYGIRGFPTIIFFSPEGNIIETVVGYRNAHDFAVIMESVLNKVPARTRAKKEEGSKPVVMKGEADIIYLANGKSVRGVILKETPLVVELEIGGGSITINRSDVKSIKRANPKDLADFKGSLEAKQDRLKAQSNIFADERERRFKEYGDWTMDEARRRAERQQVGGDVKIVRDPMSRSILVEAVLNNGVNVTLTLDTGAAVIVLSKDVGDKLGVNMSDQTKDVRELRLAGGKTAKAKMVMLKSVDVQGIEEKDVLAAILFDDAGRIGFRDGLLGMTFLGRFSMGLDMEKMKMSLKRLR